MGDLADGLHGRATVICVLPWGDDPFVHAWLRASRAVSVVDGAVHPKADVALLDPVVETAMEEMAGFENHANALASGPDKAFAVHMLLKLHAADYGCNEVVLMRSCGPLLPARFCTSGWDSPGTLT
ncbi:hypothetical protein [Streptomyces phaeochromogenes]|uniref:hypothetical protein n=1 Tax=Streptomyces phaeochromogenes TaxID=1923 RepID=UPI00371C6BA8